MSDTTTAPADTAASTTNPLADQPEALTKQPTATTSTQASIGQRVGAYLIDAVIAMIAATVISTVVGQVSSILGFLLSFIGMAYILLRDALPFLDGQSIGKKALGLRAVTTDGQSLSGNWSPGLIRNAVLLIPFFAIVELIILITKKDAPEGLLRLGDQWAGTKVITGK